VGTATQEKKCSLKRNLRAAKQIEQTPGGMGNQVGGKEGKRKEKKKGKIEK